MMDDFPALDEFGTPIPLNRDKRREPASALGEVSNEPLPIPDGEVIDLTDEQGVSHGD